MLRDSMIPSTNSAVLGGVSTATRKSANDTLRLISAASPNTTNNDAMSMPNAQVSAKFAAEKG